jgi:hypothetical protein
MDLKEKVTEALRQALRPGYVWLEDDEGVYGFVVSPRFRGVSSLDRQRRINKALRNSPVGLSAAELRRVQMIAGLTPVEYEEVGTKIRVQKVKTVAGGEVEVTIHGGLSDAEYVRGALKNEKGVRTNEPKQAPGAVGVLMSFRAKGVNGMPLSKARVVSALKKDPLIEVMPSA